MATDPDTLDGDVLELGEPPEDQGAEVNDQAEQSEQEDEVLPTFADAAEEEQDDSTLAKHLRAQIRERDRKLAEYARAEQPASAIVVGEKPTLESCDYDEEKFETELDAYKDRKRQAEDQQNAGNEAQQAAARQWQDEQQDYLKKRTALPFKPETIDDAESVVASTLDHHQIAIIVKSANNAPALNLALSRHPAKLAAIAGIKDYVKFTAAVVRLEAEVKMPTRRPTAEPDKIVRGSASLAGADKELERLEAKAARDGGDRSEIIAYKEKMKRK